MSASDFGMEVFHIGVKRDWVLSCPVTFSEPGGPLIAVKPPAGFMRHLRVPFRVPPAPGESFSTAARSDEPTVFADVCADSRVWLVVRSYLVLQIAAQIECRRIFRQLRWVIKKLLLIHAKWIDPSLLFFALILQFNSRLSGWRKRTISGEWIMIHEGRLTVSSDEQCLDSPGVYQLNPHLREQAGKMEGSFTNRCEDETGLYGAEDVFSRVDHSRSARQRWDLRHPLYQPI